MGNGKSYLVSDAFGQRIVTPPTNGAGNAANSEPEAVKDHAYYRGQVQARFASLSDVISRAALVNASQQAYLKNLEHDSNITIDQKGILKAESARYVKEQITGLHGEFVTGLAELSKALKASYMSFDLGSPALANALQMIGMGGSSLSAETRETIRAQFAGEQPALQALKAAYLSRGVFEGELDKAVYNLDNEMAGILMAGEHALHGDGSINDLTGAIGKVAKLEGMEFAPVPDTTAGNQ